MTDQKPTSTIVPAALFAGEKWYALTPETLEANVRVRIEACEISKMGSVLELIELTSVLSLPAGEMTITPPSDDAPDLFKLRKTLEGQVAEWNCRIQALVRILELSS